MTNNNKLIPTLLGYIALLIWSTSALFTSKVAALPVFEILFIIFFIAFGVSAIKLTVTRQWYKMKLPLSVWILGVLGVCAHECAYVFAFQNAPAVHADLIIYLWPIFVLAMLGLSRDDTTGFKYFLAVFIGFAGVTILIIEPSSATSFAEVRLEHLTGYIAALFCAIIWSTYVIFSRKLKHIPSEIIGLYFGFGGIIALACHASFEDFIVPSASDITNLAALGFLVLGIAYTLWDYGIKRGNLRILSVLSYGNPIISVSMLMLFGGAQYKTDIITASILIITATVIGATNWRYVYDKYIANTMNILITTLPAKKGSDG